MVVIRSGGCRWWVAVAVVVSASCSSGDDDVGAVERVDSNKDDREESSGETGEAGSNKGDAGEEGSGSNLEPAGGETPRDADLDVVMRHPAGVTIRLNSVAFEGNDIKLDAEIINGARWSVRLHGHRNKQYLLRLVDDAGQEYHFVETDDGELRLESGESVTGTLAFRGPLVGRTEQLRLVTNESSDIEDIDDFDIDDQPVGSSLVHRFVIPFDLTWE